MKVLITGGLGFIGYTFAKFLKLKKHDVHILDKKTPTSSQRNEFTCFSFDMSNKEKFSLLGEKYDYIFHFAAQSGGYKSLLDPQEDCLYNCLATVNLIDYCKKTNIKKIILSSSMSVYGNNEFVTEETKENPISFYGVSKLASENYVKLLYEHNNIPYTIYRLFATYGAGQDMDNLHQGIVSIYLKYALDTGEVPITGKKDRVRSLVHVNDVCEAFYLSISNEKTDSQTYNVLHEEPQTPEKIINQISKVLNKKVSIIEKKGYVGDQTHITGVNNKLKSIGWEPKFNLSLGVKHFYDNFENI
ncbi:NAD-dependent epimerase/dehydratase family protein [Microbulbifer sp. TRSA005]|uniref:NAD-dependent epimerase/dehydratase family protein n=1 Tax=unclassified Microbulbifer TaxID=2619833 RepID=UPI004039517D